MAYLYADFPVKKDANGDPIEDDKLKHSAPVLYPGDKLRWRLVSDEFTPADLKKMQFRIDDVKWDPSDEDHPNPSTPCGFAHAYPLQGNKGSLDWSPDDVKETNLKGASGGKRTFPKKGGVCSCPYHPYKAIARVRWKGSGSMGNLVDPHVKFHREGQ